MKASGSPSARIAIVSTVHGPIPGSAASCRAGPLPVAAHPEVDLSAGERACELDQGVTARLREGQRGRVERCQGGRCREQVSQPAGRVGDLFAVSGHQPGGVRARRRGGHLLPEHRAHRELGRVDGSRNPASRGLVARAGQARGSPLSRSPTAAGSASRSRSRLQRLIAIARSRRSDRASWQAMWSGSGRRVTMPWPCGRRSVRR